MCYNNVCDSQGDLLQSTTKEDLNESEVGIMYKMRVLSVLLIAVFGGSNAKGTIIYGDWLIHEGDEYDIVSVVNNATVGMTGGEVGHLHTNDSSTLNLFGGMVSWLIASDTSTMNIYGALIEHALIVDRQSTVNLFGGTICQGVTIPHSGIVNVYGYAFDFRPGNEGNGWLSGYWLDNTPFSIYFMDSADPFPGSQIVLIPEPNTLVVLLLGGLMLRKRTVSCKNQWL